MSETVCLRLSYAMMVFGLLVAYQLSKTSAKYGRYANPSGMGVPARLAWFLQELPALLFPLVYIFSSSNAYGFVLNAAFIAHYFHRAILYPISIRSKTSVPIHVVLFAVLFCALNGWLQAKYNAYYIESTAYDWFAYPFGGAIFLIGFWINRRADRMLQELRPAGETRGYKIPKTFLYEYVSCPNYLGEIIEWTGYAIAARSIPATAFLVFVVCNLAPRARSHHAWYLSEFREYPRDRKALIPLFW